MEKIAKKYYDKTKDLTENQRMKLIDIITTLKQEGYSEADAIKIALIRIKDADQKMLVKH